MDQSFDFPAFIGTTKAADEPLALQYEKYRKKRCRFRVFATNFDGIFWSLLTQEVWGKTRPSQLWVKIHPKYYMHIHDCINT